MLDPAAICLVVVLVVPCRWGCRHAGDIRRSMMKECDFVAEARNIGEFSNYLDRNGLRQVATAPFVYTELSSKRCVCSLYGTTAPEVQ